MRMKRFLSIVLALLLVLTLPTISSAKGQDDKSFPEGKLKSLTIKYHNSNPTKDSKKEPSVSRVTEHEIHTTEGILPSSTEKLDASQLNATNYFNLSVMMVPLEGGGQVEGWWKVDTVEGDEPDSVVLEFTLAGRNTRDSGTYYPIGGVTKVLTISNPYQGQYGHTSAFSFTQTKYTILDVKIYVYEDGALIGSGRIYDGQMLLNKVAMVYPYHSDPYSGKFMTQPERTDWAQTTPISWTTTDRDNYKKWYNQTYPNHSWNWNETQIHHIRPRNYGGTNSYDNLIPIPTQHHYLVSSWWSNY